eukprot:Phypoly_transcript_17062.p1 GENE.Phypoly_transcript_17062~~Phypoly_transcript_17062.p1  ORF type:complete len:219 (+),score=29.04 Phypoly_transcript_17062:155-811(+)
MQVLKRLLWEPYVRALDKRPLFTKMCTASVLMGVGDAVSQNIEKIVQKRSAGSEKQVTSPYDIPRTLRMAAVGMFLSGPLLHVWYKVLDKWMAGPPTKALLFKKIAADQLLYTPISLAGFLAVLPLLEGKPPSAIKDRLKSDFTPILLTNWTVWPAAQYVNFAYIPTDQRVLYVTTLGIVWNSFLSYMGNRNAKAKNEENKEEDTSTARGAVAEARRI